MQSIIEYLRESIVEQLNSTSFSSTFPVWKQSIDQLIPNKTEMQIFNLGDHLSEIFLSTATSGRTQNSLAMGGAVWEALICWYLNLCLIGRRTIVIKHNANFIPQPISDAITVNYNNFRSNSESDLIALTFPDKPEYSMDKDSIHIKDINGLDVPTAKKNGTYNTLAILNALAHRDFNEIEIHIIQSKTNWNDNAQIPMLWDAVYAATSFTNGMTVGTQGYSIHDCKAFTYSFVTVPTNDLRHFTQTCVAVLRVRNISGGNYWGFPTKQGVANSIKEMLTKNLSNGSKESIISSIKKAVPEIETTYSYFGL